MLIQYDTIKIVEMRNFAMGMLFIDKLIGGVVQRLWKNMHLVLSTLKVNLFSLNQMLSFSNSLLISCSY